MAYRAASIEWSLLSGISSIQAPFLSRMYSFKVNSAKVKGHRSESMTISRKPVSHSCMTGWKGSEVGTRVVGTRVGSAFHFLLSYRSPLPDKSIHAAKAKRRTESQIHHVVQCDIGQQIPFEDDGNRRFVPDLERLLVERRTYPCFPCMNENTSPCSSTERTFAFKAFQVLN